MALGALLLQCYDLKPTNIKQVDVGFQYFIKLEIFLLKHMWTDSLSAVSARKKLHQLKFHQAGHSHKPTDGNRKLYALGFIVNYKHKYTY